MKHTAIPTVYRGIRFRSRLEAKWAFTFDIMRWPWEYEPYDLEGWIPDFFVDICDGQKPILVDVKPHVIGLPPPALQLKIERAMGLPDPESPYRAGVLGAFPLKPPVDVWLRSNVRGLGWLYTPTHWVELWDFPKKDDLGAAWWVAGNDLQWKAPV